MLHNARQNIFHKMGEIYMLFWAEKNDNETDACILSCPYSSHQNWPTEYLCHQNKPPQPSISYFLNIILSKKTAFHFVLPGRGVPDQFSAFVTSVNYLVAGGCLYFCGACHQVCCVVAPSTIRPVLCYIYRLVPVRFIATDHCALHIPLARPHHNLDMNKTLEYCIQAWRPYLKQI